MKYFKTFGWMVGILVLAIIGIMITSPSAGAAGERSAGIAMMLCGVIAVWVILELVALGKKEEPSPQQQEPGK